MWGTLMPRAEWISFTVPETMCRHSVSRSSDLSNITWAPMQIPSSFRPDAT